MLKLVGQSCSQVCPQHQVFMQQHSIGLVEAQDVKGLYQTNLCSFNSVCCWVGKPCMLCLWRLRSSIPYYLSYQRGTLIHISNSAAHKNCISARRPSGTYILYFIPTISSSHNNGSEVDNRHQVRWSSPGCLTSSQSFDPSRRLPTFWHKRTTGRSCITTTRCRATMSQWLLHATSRTCEPSKVLSSNRACIPALTRHAVNILFHQFFFHMHQKKGPKGCHSIEAALYVLRQ